MPLQDRLLNSLRRCCRSLPDQRRGWNATYDMADFALAGFAPFFMQSPSFLAHQRHLETGQGRSNCQTLFGMRKIPGDSQIRAKLDAIEPAMFHPMFADLVAELDQCGGLDAMRCLDGRVLIALDGTEFHCSDKIHCPNCSHRKRGKDKIEYFHTLLAATSWRPDITGSCRWSRSSSSPGRHDKQDCEAAPPGAGWRRTARFDPVYLATMFSPADLPGGAGYGGHFLFVCKPDSHKAIEEFRVGIRLDERVDRIRIGKKWVSHRYQWLSGVPLRGDEKAMTVNWLMIEISDANGKVTYRNSFITDLDVGGKMSPNSPPAAGPDGRLKTRASMSSKPRDTTWSITSGTESSIWRPCSRSSICWPSPVIPSVNWGIGPGVRRGGNW